ncbi:mitochondrial carrier domain-containing protein, partial [Mycena filopes]
PVSTRAWAGGLAGTAVDLLFFPIDTIKTRLQSPQGFARAGGFKGIYKGVGSVGVGSAPGACLVRVPTEVIKTRAQTSTYGPGQSSLSAARFLLASDGWKGFYRGFGSTIMREIPFTSIQFPLYELLKSRLSTFVGRKPLYAHEAAVCGSFAGGVAAALTTPLDVLKTRVMLDMRDATKEKLPSLSARLKNIYVAEGVPALFAGVVPRTLWISAGGAVFLGVYEWAVNGLIGW